MAFRLGMAQILVEGGQPEANLKRAEQAVKELADRGAQVVLLPEALNLGWTHSSCHQVAESIPDGPTCQRLGQLARVHGIHVVVGLVECESTQIYNAAVWIDTDGKVILKHRKIHELDIAHDCYQQGQSLQVVDTELGRVGVMICADAFAPNFSVSRALGAMGAQVILSPCAWAVPPNHDPKREPYGQLWRDCYAPVCAEYSLSIAGCSNVGSIELGPWQGHRCIGCSLVMDATGKVLWTAPYGEESQQVVVIDLI